MLGNCQPAQLRLHTNNRPTERSSHAQRCSTSRQVRHKRRKWPDRFALRAAGHVSHVRSFRHDGLIPRTLRRCWTTFIESRCHHVAFLTRISGREVNADPLVVRQFLFQSTRIFWIFREKGNCDFLKGRLESILSRLCVDVENDTPATGNSRKICPKFRSRSREDGGSKLRVARCDSNARRSHARNYFIKLRRCVEPRGLRA